MHTHTPLAIGKLQLKIQYKDTGISLEIKDMYNHHVDNTCKGETTQHQILFQIIAIKYEQYK